MRYVLWVAILCWLSTAVAQQTPRRLAFVTERDGDAEIYVVNDDGTGLKRLTRNPSEDTHPTWSPDGKTIVFVSDRDGNDEIYVMNADGTTQQIPLIADENIRDWGSPPALLPHETGTQSRIAWTGTTKVFPVVSIFQMLWVNPNPSVPVKAVRFANPTRTACPILIAVTAAVRDEKAAAAQAAARDHARELLSQGLAAMKDGKDTEARDLFRQAVKEDPALEAAYRALGQVCEKLKDEDGALAAYRAWVQAGAHSPLPFNRIGEILERRKDYRGALDAYSASLGVEWNQPPIIEAKARMEQLVYP